MSRALQFALLGLLAVVILMIYFVPAPSHPVPRLQGPLPEMIEMFVSDPSGEAAVLVGRSTSVADLVALLKGGVWMPPHACISKGSLRLHYRDQSVRSIVLLPGHHDSRFEFALDGVGYSVERSEFFQILSRMGIDGQRLLQGL